MCLRFCVDFFPCLGFARQLFVQSLAPVLSVEVIALTYFSGYKLDGLIPAIT